MTNFTDKNGKKINLGDELNVPLEVFSTGIVVHNDKKELSLELKYEGKKIPLRHLDHVFEHVEVN